MSTNRPVTRLFSLLLSILVVFGLFAPGAVAASELHTSFNPDDYFSFSVSGSTLTVSGVSSNKDNTWLLVKAGSESHTFHFTPGVPFTKSVPLTVSGLVEIYAGPEEYGKFQGLIFDSVRVKKQSDGSFIITDSPTLEHNRTMRSAWLSPGQHLSGPYSDKIKSLATQITAGASSDYEKLLLIHSWITHNIYYDFTAYENGTSSKTEPNEVLAAGYALCRGFSNLFAALSGASGIPSLVVTGYVLTDKDDGVWSATHLAATRSNHAWNEAYVDGRWIIIDTTWDTRNEYRRGVKTKKDPTLTHFDITPEFFATTYRILVRPTDTDVPSGWAKTEVARAFEKNLVPHSLQKNYSANITREQFCTLVVRLIEEMSGKSVSMLIAEKGVGVVNAFKDTSNPDILAAYALGIVVGRSEGVFSPNGFLYRSEAATILYRVGALLFELSAENEPIVFSDSDQIPYWAANAVDYVSAAGIMNGASNNKFNPSGKYSRQEAILTVLRLYEFYTNYPS